MSDTGKSAAEMMAGISVKPTAAELREAREREAQAERALLAAGTIWRENDPRSETPRFVRVIRVDRDDAIIRSVTEDGQNAPRSRPAFARKDRFGGTKRGNYAFVRAST